MRRRLFWRLAFVVPLFFLLSTSVCALLLEFAAASLGWRPLPILLNPVTGAAALLIFLLLAALLLRVGAEFRRAAVPVGDLVQAAGQVAAGDYAVRVREHGPREVRSLAHAFNLMAAQLKANDEQRRNLMADVAHELRTPLTVIQGNLEGMLDGIYPRDDAHLGSVLEETRLLARLVEDVRTLALAEAEALVLHLEATDLGALVRATADSFRPQAEAAGVECFCEVEPDLPVVAIDRERMSQVLANLVSNALRYTPRGGRIELWVGREPDHRGANGVAITVRDTGAGIAPEQLPHIFDRFYKSRDSHGAGLGLAIAKHLVAAQGGEITAESEPGRGTLMRVRL